MTKKRTLIVICCVLVFYLLLSSVIKILPSPISWLLPRKEVPDPSIEIINDHGIQIYCYGEPFTLPEGIEMHEIIQLNPDSFPVTKEYEKSFLIINDRSGSLSLSEDRIEFVRTLIYEKHLPVIYFGVTYLRTWDDPNAVGYIQISGARGRAYQYELGKIMPTIGIWTDAEEESSKVNPDLMGQIIADHIERYIRTVF